jgi:hypothetical protein
VAKKALSLSEITELMKAPKKAEPKPGKVPDFFVANAEEFMKLMDAKVRTITIGDYVLRVKSRPSRDEMFVAPDKGFVPCGWFTRKWLQGVIDEKG